MKVHISIGRERHVEQIPPPLVMVITFIREDRPMMVSMQHAMV